MGTLFLFFYLFFCANSSNCELQFHRVIPTQLTPDRLERNIESISRWPQWFHSLKQAEMIHPSKTQQIQPGSTISLAIDPKKGAKKQFKMTLQVKEYIPAKKLTLTLLKDSSGRISRIFDHLEWTIELEPTPEGSLIRGLAIAHTCHWRSRLLGQIATKILMNQVFYPDLIKLSQLRQPFSLDLPSETGLSQI